ncbi:hypothetical protein Tco_0074071 [Tanacetum coccineum]
MVTESKPQHLHHQQQKLELQKYPNPIRHQQFCKNFQNLKKKVKALSKIDHSEVIEESVQANVFNEVKNQLSKLLPKVVSDFVKPRMESIVHDVLQKNLINLFKSSSSSTSLDLFFEFELKNMLYDKIQKSGSFQTHEKHLDLYNALIGTISLDEVITKGEIDPTKVLKKRHHDDKDEDPPTDSEKKKKRRRRKDSKPSKEKDQSGSSKAGKTPSKPSSTDKSINTEETVHEVAIEADDAPEQTTCDVQYARPETPDPEWHKELNADDAPEQTWFNDLMNAEKDPLTFDDMMGSTVNFTKFARHHLKKDKITKADLEGPAYKILKGTCRNSIELEYNLEQCYLALSDQLDWENLKGDKCPYDISKPLPLQGPPGYLTILVDFFFNNDLEYLKTGNKERKYVASLTKTKAARYELKDQKEYTFKEADFSRLHLNDIEDMFLLYVQHKIHNLTGGEIVDLKKLNIIRPQTTCDGISSKEPYTIVYDPRGVVYLNKSNRKILMRADELYNFCDGTLKSVRDTLHHMLHNFVLRYNHGMPKRAWTKKDQKWIDEIVKQIDNMLLERQIMRSLECFVIGRTVEADYRLLTRTE